jgi:hypothetical protein
LQGLTNGVEGLGPTGLGEWFGIGEGTVLTELSQGGVGLLRAVQVAALQGAAELLKVSLTILIEALEFLKN